MDLYFKKYLKYKTKYLNLLDEYYGGKKSLGKSLNKNAKKSSSKSSKK